LIGSHNPVAISPLSTNNRTKSEQCKVDQHEMGAREAMMALKEPNYSSERELEDAVGEAIKEMLNQRDLHSIVLRGFGLDLAVFFSENGTASARFFEVKSFAGHHGRCGFGNQRGEGNQIRLLYNQALGHPRSHSELRLFNDTIRWVLGNQSMPYGSARFALFTCEEAQLAAANGVKPGKQNNFRLSFFDSTWVRWPEFLESMQTFLTIDQ
jgi:hypothetical protein